MLQKRLNRKWANQISEPKPPTRFQMVFNLVLNDKCFMKCWFELVIYETSETNKELHFECQSQSNAIF